MAAAIKALNAKIRSNPVTDYVFSTRAPSAYTSLTSADISVQTFSGPCRISVSPSLRSWILKKILNCVSLPDRLVDRRVECILIASKAYLAQ